MNALAWGAKVSPAFRERVRDIAADIGTDPSWLMACMAFETDRTFSPSVRNPSSSATGLIQFMADTARDLGTTVEDLARMTAEDQLEFVHRYFKPFRGRLGSLGDCYMAILWPPAVGKPDDYVVFSSAKAAYRANSALDINKDGVVTKRECYAFVERMLSEGLQQQNVAFEDAPQPGVRADPQPAPAPATQQKREAPRMAIPALIAAFGPMIVEMIPTIAKLFDRKAETPAKIEAATKALDTIVRATDTLNVQAAVEKMQSDPAALTAARNAVVTEPTIMGLLEVGGGIERAREQVHEMATLPPQRNVALLVTGALAPLIYIVVCAVVFLDGWSDEMRSVVVTAIVTGLLGSITGFFLGSSFGSQRKTDMINDRGPNG
jgi:hypothetical protein